MSNYLTYLASVQKRRENLIEIGSFLVTLPLAMRHLGHQSIEGHSVYLQNLREGTPLDKAKYTYLEWFIDPTNPENIKLMENFWGGKSAIVDAQRMFVEKALKDKLDA